LLYHRSPQNSQVPRLTYPTSKHRSGNIIHSLSTRASGDRAALNVAYAPGAATRRDERAPTTNARRQRRRRHSEKVRHRLTELQRPAHTNVFITGWAERLEPACAQWWHMSAAAPRCTADDDHYSTTRTPAAGDQQLTRDFS